MITKSATPVLESKKLWFILPQCSPEALWLWNKAQEVNTRICQDLFAACKRSHSSSSTFLWHVRILMIIQYSLLNWEMLCVFRSELSCKTLKLMQLIDKGLAWWEQLPSNNTDCSSSHSMQQYEIDLMLLVHIWSSMPKGPFDIVTLSVMFMFNPTRGDLTYRTFCMQ